jgi:hypothetical protein
MKSIFLIFLSFCLVNFSVIGQRNRGAYSPHIRVETIGTNPCFDSVRLTYTGPVLPGSTYNWINESHAFGVIGASVSPTFRTIRQPNAPGTYPDIAGFYCLTITNAQYPAGMNLWTCTLPQQSGSATYNAPEENYCPIDSIGYIAHSLYLRSTIDYVWDHGPTTCRISGRVPGTFIRTSFFTDSTGCRRALFRNTYRISNNATKPIISSTTTPNTNCAGVRNGTILLNRNVTGWSFFYRWDSGLPPTHNLTGLAAGTYNVTTTSENGCTTTNSITVTNNTVNPRITSATTPNTNCTGASTGSITLTTNATTFAWDNSLPATQNQTGLAAGTYNVTATGTNGCTATASITVTNNTVNPTITSATTPNTNCTGAQTGTITLTTNATSFAWSNSSTAQNQTGLAAGTYNVTATGTNGCTATASITVTNNIVNPTITSATTPNTNCTGAQTGSITLTTNATTFVWDNSLSATQNQTGLAAGTYNVTATGANGCTATASITVTNKTVNPTITSVTTPNTNCAGIQTGSITLENYMTSFASFVWSNSSTIQNPTGLSAGAYNVTATGTNGCTTTASITVTNNIVNPTITSATTPNTNCTGAQTGTIRLTSNATTFVWSNTATTQNITGLAAGTYNVTATGTNGCTATTSVTVTGNYTYPNFQTSSRENERCTGAQTGAITMSTNATSFVWSNTATTQNITGLAAGTYTVTATGTNGCTATANAVVTNKIETPWIHIYADPNTNCTGAQTGAITMSTNATSFVWSNNTTTQNLTSLAAGVYTVTATATNGCTVVGAALVIDETRNPMLGTSTAPNTNCAGTKTGSITLTTNATSFAWNNNLPATQNQTGLSAGTYTVTATGTNGCTATASITVTNNTVNPTIISSIRGDYQGWSVWLSTNAITFAWSNGATTKDLMGLSAGAYNVTATGTNGCTATTSVTVPNISTGTEITTEKFGIYPNPTTGRIYFSQKAQTQVLLYNESGENLSRSSLEVDYCDLSEYPTGVYMIIINHTALKVVKK